MTYHETPPSPSTEAEDLARGLQEGLERIRAINNRMLELAQHPKALAPEHVAEIKTTLSWAVTELDELDEHHWVVCLKAAIAAFNEVYP